MLHALPSVVARLAVGDPLDACVPSVLRTLQSALGSREASVWLASPSGLDRMWATGDRLMTAPLLNAVLERPDASRDDLKVVRLGTADRRLGVLAVVLADPLGVDGAELVVGVADALAPRIHQEEQHRVLEVEVAMRLRQLDEERRFTERIIDALPVGLYVIDREYRIRAWNRKRETGMQGISREEAIGRPLFEVLHRQPADLLRREFDEVFETGRLQSFQVESSTTGDVRTYRISKIPMRIGGDDVTHVVTIGEDITEWKEAQERFAQAEKLAAIGQLAAGAMHEINNPLATIAACAEGLGLKLEDLAQDGVTVPQGSVDYLQIIDNEVHRCKQIVEGLLDFSRPKQVLMERVDVNETVARTLFLLKHHAGFKRLTVRTELDTTLPVVRSGSRDRLMQVMMALLMNALDAMNGQGDVIIRTRAGETPGEEIVLEVIDRGPGIPRSEIPKIFEPFYTTKPAGRGTGLGLSICYGIVDDHGGRIDVDSVMGVGSTFRVILPAERP